jgi:tetratricopeptide (TPR) repeat protein
MKSEHRHELQTNELADFISKLPEYLKKNLRTIIAIVLIVVGVISWPILNKKKQVSHIKEQIETTELINRLDQGKAQVLNAGAAEFSGIFLVSANALERAADKAKSGATKALALIKRGEAFRTDLHYKSEAVEREVVTNHIEQARSAYEKAITAAKRHKTLVAMAKFGLGLCAEEVGEYDKAAEIYKSIADDADFAGTVYPVRARHRMAIMGDHSDKFIFAKAPAPAENIEMDLPDLAPLGPIEIETQPATPPAEVN